MSPHPSVVLIATLLASSLGQTAASDIPLDIELAGLSAGYDIDRTDRSLSALQAQTYCVIDPYTGSQTPWQFWLNPTTNYVSVFSGRDNGGFATLIPWPWLLRFSISTPADLYGPRDAGYLVVH